MDACQIGKDVTKGDGGNEDMSIVGLACRMERGGSRGERTIQTVIIVIYKERERERGRSRDRGNKERRN